MQAAQSQEHAVAWDDRVLASQSAPHFMQSSTWEAVRSAGPWRVSRRGLGIERDFPVLVFERLAEGFGLLAHLPRVSGLGPADVPWFTERVRAERGTAFAWTISSLTKRRVCANRFLTTWMPAANRPHCFVLMTV